MTQRTNTMERLKKHHLEEALDAFANKDRFTYRGICYWMLESLPLSVGERFTKHLQDVVDNDNNGYGVNPRGFVVHPAFGECKMNNRALRVSLLNYMIKLKHYDQ